MSYVKQKFLANGINVQGVGPNWPPALARTLSTSPRLQHAIGSPAVKERCVQATPSEMWSGPTSLPASRLKVDGVGNAVENDHHVEKTTSDARHISESCLNKRASTSDKSSASFAAAVKSSSRSIRFETPAVEQKRKRSSNSESSANSTMHRRRTIFGSGIFRSSPNGNVFQRTTFVTEALSVYPSLPSDYSFICDTADASLSLGEKDEGEESETADPTSDRPDCRQPSDVAGETESGIEKTFSTMRTIPQSTPRSSYRSSEMEDRSELLR